MELDGTFANLPILNPCSRDHHVDEPHVADHGEQRSQRIMSELELTQSTASRQLTQLWAAGFLASRNCEGAKCYSLAEDRLRDTFQAVLAFLAVSP